MLVCKAQLWLVSPKNHLAFKLLVSKIYIALLCQEGTRNHGSQDTGKSLNLSTDKKFDNDFYSVH